MKKVLLSFLIGSFLFNGVNAQNNIKQNGFNRIYYPNGKVLSEGNLKDGKPDGYWKSYYTTGILKSEGNRKNFLLDSVWIFYNSIGDTIQKINYLYGKKNGYSFEYNTDRSKIDEVGKVISKELYVNDLKEGKSFYYSNNIVVEETNYLDNRKDGLSIEYDKDGRIISINRYRKGSIVERERINRYNNGHEKDGIWKSFFEDIKVKVEENYKNGLLDGYHKEYNLQGKLLLTLLYKDGKLINDTVQENNAVIVIEKKDSSGNVIESGPYLRNIAIGIHKEFDKEGNIINSRIFNNDGELVSMGIIDKEGKMEGLWKEFYKEGKTKSEGLYKNNLREGKWNFYFNDGRVEQTGSYKNGKENGLWKWFYNTGEISKEEEFYEGKRDGSYTEYDKLGNILMSGSYIEDEKEGEWNLKINDFIAKGKYVSGLKDGIWKYYYDDNSVMFEGEYIQGNAEGRHRYYYPDNKLKEEQFYINGIPDKLWKKYDEEGNIIVAITYDKGKEYRINGVRIDLPDDKVKIIE
jgi:antitoxin component YwqK of YwqJK toxin-antitoxin module